MKPPALRNAFSAPRNSQRKLRRAFAALSAATDSDSLIQAAFRILAIEFPGGFTSVTLRNMDAQPNFWLSSRGHRLELGPTPAAFDCHPAADFVRKHPGIKVSRSSDVLPPWPVLRRTEFYRQSMKPMDWRYAIAIFFWEQETLYCIFSAFRSAAEGDYSLGELRKAERLHEPINQALRRVKALGARRAAQKGLEALVEQLPLPTVIVDWNLKPIFHNVAVRELCGELREGSRGLKHRRDEFELPASLLQACQELKTKCESNINTSPARLRGKGSTRQFSSPELRGSVTLIHAPYPSVAQPTFLIKLEKIGAAGALNSSDQLAVLAKLTPSQRDITALVCEGKSNQEISDALSRTVGTIKTELNSIFKKLGIPSRSKLMLLFSSSLFAIDPILIWCELFDWFPVFQLC